MKKKHIMKSIESLEKQKQEHKKKIEDYGGKNYTLIEYWEKEIGQFDEEIKKRRRDLEKDG